ncbi:MAG TPA: NapC/NirT family cytochrome c [Pelomicrobium sp.]|nr:NapC/NirT family cytochrome c [Pelomicrobium sp.]
MNRRPGAIARFLKWLTTPSGKYSVLTLVGIGLIIGAGGFLGSAAMIHYTGTNEFCATACHDRGGMAIPTKEWKQSVHYANPSGVMAGCSDCHIPHTYPEKLIRKAQAGITDAYHTALGTISTPEKYEANRWRMANQVWEDMRANDSAECRHCHQFTPEALAVQAKENEVAAQMHKTRKEQGMTCIDCHKGVAHEEPEDPAEKKAAAKPAEPAPASGSEKAAAPAAGEKPVQVAAAGSGGEAAAKEAGCFACHAVETKKMGPALKDAAAAFKTQGADALAKYLAAGEKHPPVEAKPEQLKAIADWILTL